MNVTDQKSRERRGRRGLGLMGSTRAFIREARRTPDYSLFDLIHGIVYARWPYLYIGIGTGEHWLGRLYSRIAASFSPQAAVEKRDQPAKWDGSGDSGTFADGYHGKVVPLDSARRLVTVNEDISLHDLEQVIPFSRARDIVLKNPDHIVALECPCRSVRSEPCLPLEVCLVIGEPFASFVAEHHPRRSRRISQAEAEGILRAEHERGHVHHAFFKDAMLNRFYAICNCCSCCCGAIQSAKNGTPMLISSGYECAVDVDLCIGCGECEEVCPFEALSYDGDLAHVDGSACMGCGVCTSACDQGSLSLRRDAREGQPLLLHELVSVDSAGEDVQLHPD